MVALGTREGVPPEVCLSFFFYWFIGTNTVQEASRRISVGARIKWLGGTKALKHGGQAEDVVAAPGVYEGVKPTVVKVKGY